MKRVKIGEIGDIVYDAVYPKTYNNYVVIGFIGDDAVITKKGNLKRKVGVMKDARILTWSPHRLGVMGHVVITDAMKEAVEKIIIELKDVKSDNVERINVYSFH